MTYIGKRDWTPIKNMDVRYREDRISDDDNDTVGHEHWYVVQLTEEQQKVVDRLCDDNDCSPHHVMTRFIKEGIERHG